MGASPSVITRKTYLDDNGNPIQAKGKVYLDEQGNPAHAQAQSPQPTLKPRGQIKGALQEAALVPFKALGIPESERPVQDLLTGLAGMAGKFFSDPEGAGRATRGYIDREAQGQFQQGIEAAREGHIIDPLVRSVTGSVPVIGPLVGKGLDILARGRQEGSLPEMVRGAGEIAAPLAPFSAPLRAGAATAAQKGLQGLKRAAEVPTNAAASLVRAPIQRLAGVNLEKLQQTAALPQEVQSTLQSSLAAEKAKMRAYAKAQYEPVDAKVGAVALAPEEVGAIQQSLTPKLVREILDNGDVSSPSFSQVQELKSAIHRAGARSSDPRVQQGLFSVRDSLEARLNQVASEAGALPEFQNANLTFKQYAKDWLESPLADALDATNPTDVIRPFTGKDGAAASELAQKYQVDTGSLNDFLALGESGGKQMLQDAPLLKAQGPRQFADTKLSELGNRPWTEFDRSLAVGGVVGGAVSPPVGLTTLGVLAARRSPSLLRSPMLRRMLTKNLPEQFAKPAPEPFAPTVQGEFVQNPAAASTGFIPQPRLPAVGQTSPPLNRGTGIPPTASPTPEGRGLLLPSGERAVTDAATKMASVGLQPELNPKLLMAPSGGEILPPSRIRQGRAIPMGESTIPQIPGQSDPLLTGLMDAANVGKGPQRPLLMAPPAGAPVTSAERGVTLGKPVQPESAVTAPDIRSAPRTMPFDIQRVPLKPRSMEMPASSAQEIPPPPAPKVSAPAPAPLKPRFSSKERAEVANAPAPTKEQMNQTLSTETAELKRRLLSKPASAEEKAQALKRIKENEEMMSGEPKGSSGAKGENVKFETKDGKVGKVDAKGKFSVAAKTSEPEGGWAGRTVAWMDKGTRYEMKVDAVITDKQGRVLLKGDDGGTRHVEAHLVKVKK